MDKPPVKHTFCALDSMRGLFAIYIVLFHLAAFSVFMEPKSMMGFTTTSFIIAKGYVGVEFFFMLSIFVFLYHYKDTNLLTPARYLGFQTKRLKRIYPLHIVILLLFAPINLHLLHNFPHVTHAGLDLKYLIGHLTLTHSWGWLDQIGFNIVAWYLSIQFMIYLISPFFSILYNRMKTLMAFSAIVRTLIGFPNLADWGQWNAIAALGVVVLSIFLQRCIDEPLQRLFKTQKKLPLLQPTPA